EAVGPPLGRGDEAAVVETRADVPVVAGDKAACVQTTADFDDVGANLVFGSSTQSWAAFGQHKSGITAIDIRFCIFRSRSSFPHPRSLNRATRRCRRPDRVQVSQDSAPARRS